MAESSIYDSIVEVSEGGTTKRVYSCDMQVGRRTKQESDECGPPPKRPTNIAKPRPKRVQAPVASPAPARAEDHIPFAGESQLICMLAAERRENEALRRYADWLTNRIQVLERQIANGTDLCPNDDAGGCAPR